MNRIVSKFKELKKKGKKALITFITAGYPDLEATYQLVREMEENGADIVELGIPFSDPLADGTTIQKSSQIALEKKVTLKDILKLVGKLRRRTEIPIILMSYLNPVYRYGCGKFVRDLTAAGGDGVIFPDLIPEEAKEWLAMSKENNLATIFLASPTTDIRRLKMIASKTEGFLYYVSLTGVTGARNKLDSDLITNLTRIKRLTDKPVCCGFGISTPQQARVVSRYCDGVIIGSAIIDLIQRNTWKEITRKRVGKFVFSFFKEMAGDKYAS